MILTDCSRDVYILDDFRVHVQRAQLFLVARFSFLPYSWREKRQEKAINDMFTALHISATMDFASPTPSAFFRFSSPVSAKKSLRIALREE